MEDTDVEDRRMPFPAATFCDEAVADTSAVIQVLSISQLCLNGR